MRDAWVVHLLAHHASHFTSMTRVLIAAATPMVRAGLRALLANETIAVVGESASLATADVEAVDVLLLADEALLADARQWLPEAGHVAVLLLTDDERSAAELRELPVRGWGILSPDAARAELQAAVVAVAQGLIVLSPLLAGRLVNPRPVAALADAPVEPLTTRELEVLELLSQGLSNKLIARQLNISEHTVKFHVSSLFAKLNVTSRTEAVSRGARQGLITL